MTGLQHRCVGCAGLVGGGLYDLARLSREADGSAVCQLWVSAVVVSDLASLLHYPLYRACHHRTMFLPPDGAIMGIIYLAGASEGDGK